jgi:murein L,D-transpeptidase YcbB/YkuD
LRTFIFIALGLTAGALHWLPGDAPNAHLKLAAAQEAPPLRTVLGPATDKPPTTPKKARKKTNNKGSSAAPGVSMSIAVPPSEKVKLLPTAIDLAADNTLHPEIVKGIYLRLGGDLLLTKLRLLTPRGRALLTVLQEVGSHGLNPKDYPVGDLSSSRLADDTAAAKRDTTLVAAMVRYVIDFKVLTKAHPRLTDKDPQKVILANAQRIEDAVVALFPDPAAGLKALWPEHADYEAVRTALRRYQTLAGGNMPLLPKGRALRKRLKGKRIGILKQRLKFEGYLEGVLNDEYDDATEQAVMQFQRLHHLTQDGKVGRWTRKNINITMKARVRQLKLSLQRWREFAALHSGLPHYMRVNLPAYQLELYRDGKKYREHRIIIGKNRLDYDRMKWVQGYINRTPMFKSAIYKIQINPVWLIPPRIRDRELSSDVSVLRRKGIRTMASIAGGTVLVQSAGKHNALGRVKFMLKNTQNVYLHDTNMPWLFKNAERDYSHGCVRVENALDLARALALDLGEMPVKRFNKYLEHGYPHPVKLKHPLPVLVDYNTVHINAKGELVLLPDIYHYDYAYFRDKLPVYEKTRYGSLAMKPRQVPRIPFAKFLSLKKKGGVAPASWPSDESAEMVE